MTPKEKAEDLVNQYRIVLMDEDTDCGNELLCTSIAIKNALILVNENLIYTNYSIYWEEVKKEIEKL